MVNVSECCEKEGGLGLHLVGSPCDGVRERTPVGGLQPGGDS